MNSNTQRIDTKYNLKTLWSFVRKYKKLFYGLIIMTLLVEIIVFIDNFIFKYLIDKGTLFVQSEITRDDFVSFIILMVSLFMGLKVFEGILWYGKLQWVSRIESNIMKDLE